MRFCCYSPFADDCLEKCIVPADIEIFQNYLLEVFRQFSAVSTAMSESIQSLY